MASAEYLMALGENRWAFADADYAFVFLLMTLDRRYQVLVDSPDTAANVVTSGKLGKHLRDRIAKLRLPSDMRDEAEAIASAWVTVSDRRNSLAHAWGYSDARGISQLGGYSHKFPRGKPPVHTLMHWRIEDLREMTDDCRKISSRITNWRMKYERLKTARSRS
jgi:hypothetical protein